MNHRDERTLHRRRLVEELLQQIHQQRRQRLQLEAARIEAPRLELEAEQTRQQLADLLRNLNGSEIVRRGAGSPEKVIGALGTRRVAEHGATRADWLGGLRLDEPGRL